MQSEKASGGVAVRVEALVGCVQHDCEACRTGGWQPIETAPKNGRILLLGYYNVRGNWRTLRGRWVRQEELDDAWEYGDEYEPGWFEEAVEADAEDGGNMWATEPTHWMLLPLPPNAQVHQTQCRTDGDMK